MIEQPHSPEPPRKSWPRRHKILTAIGSVTTVIVVLGVIGAVAGGGTSPPQASAPSATVPAAAATTAPAPPPVADGKGDYQGSCDYLLANGIYDQNYLIGEIDLTNTGNVGIVVRTRITWPQEGTNPITARKTVHLPYGSSKVVRYKVPVGSIDQGATAIDLIQSWQERHSGDGCTYHVKVTSTYGQVHSS